MDPVLELGRYLHSLSDLYPYGVLLLDTQKVTLFVDLKELETQREFLHSIIEKGMKMSWEDVEIVTSSAPPANFSSRRALAFGLSITSVLQAPSLREIASNPQSKKKFWELLKEFLKQES